MDNRETLLNRIAKGSAAESVSLYLGEELDRRVQQAEGAIEQAFVRGEDTVLYRCVAQWLEVRALRAQLLRDKAFGEAAQRQL